MQSENTEENNEVKRKKNPLFWRITKLDWEAKILLNKKLKWSRAGLLYFLPEWVVLKIPFYIHGVPFHWIAPLYALTLLWISGYLVYYFWSHPYHEDTCCIHPGTVFPAGVDPGSCRNPNSYISQAGKRAYYPVTAYQPCEEYSLADKILYYGCFLGGLLLDLAIYFAFYLDTRKRFVKKFHDFKHKWIVYCTPTAFITYAPAIIVHQTEGKMIVGIILSVIWVGTFFVICSALIPLLIAWGCYYGGIDDYIHGLCNNSTSGINNEYVEDKHAIGFPWNLFWACVVWLASMLASGIWYFGIAYLPYKTYVDAVADVDNKDK